MSKVFKYQKLFEEKGIHDYCPYRDCIEYEGSAYRWGHQPLESELNFLPNYPYNEKIKMPPRINSKRDDDITFKCGMCGLSFFRTKEAALEKWEEIGEPVQQNLKYTHILIGEINKEMGVSKGNGKHFLFYEFEGVELRKTFKVADRL